MRRSYCRVLSRRRMKRRVLCFRRILLMLCGERIEGVRVEVGEFSWRLL